MKRYLRSLLVVLGLVGGVFVALTLLVHRAEKFVTALAQAWHRLKASPDVNELASDLWQLAGIVFERAALISWPVWAFVGFVIIVVTVLWHGLVVRPREREKTRVRKRLAKRVSNGNQKRQRAQTDVD